MPSSGVHSGVPVRTHVPYVNETVWMSSMMNPVQDGWLLHNSAHSVRDIPASTCTVLAPRLANWKFPHPVCSEGQTASSRTVFLTRSAVTRRPVKEFPGPNGVFRKEST